MAKRKKLGIPKAKVSKKVKSRPSKVKSYVDAGTGIVAERSEPIWFDLEVAIPEDIEVDEAEIEEAMNRTIMRVAERALELSQERCPVRSGRLKESPFLEVTTEGFKLYYDTTKHPSDPSMYNYGPIIDQGRPKTPIAGDQVIDVEDYTRITVKGTEVDVQSHYKTYRNCRVVPIQTAGGLVFRVIHEWPEIKAQGYITDSIEDAIAETDDILQEELEGILPSDIIVEDIE